MKAPDVKISIPGRALGMRGTGSNDVVIEELFVPDAGVAFSRKAGEWHPVFQIIATTAFPLIYAVYLGVAESARDIAIRLAKKKRQTTYALEPRRPHGHILARGASSRIEWMIRITERNAPSAESVNEVMIGRSSWPRHAIKTVELAMELAGGAGFYRSNGLEQRFRDVQGARFHPLQQGPQAHYAGAMALGQPVANASSDA